MDSLESKIAALAERAEALLVNTAEAIAADNIGLAFDRMAERAALLERAYRAERLLREAQAVYVYSDASEAKRDKLRAQAAALVEE